MTCSTSASQNDSTQWCCRSSCYRASSRSSAFMKICARNITFLNIGFIHRRSDTYNLRTATSNGLRSWVIASLGGSRNGRDAQYLSPTPKADSIPALSIIIDGSTRVGRAIPGRPQSMRFSICSLALPDN